MLDLVPTDDARLASNRGPRRDEFITGCWINSIPEHPENAYWTAEFGQQSLLCCRVGYYNRSLFVRKKTMKPAVGIHWQTGSRFTVTALRRNARGHPLDL